MTLSAANDGVGSEPVAAEPGQDRPHDIGSEHDDEDTTPYEKTCSQLFMAFVAGLLGDFDRYLGRGDIDFLRDGVSFRMAGLWLDDAEFAELMRALARVLQPRVTNAPRAGRRRRILGSVLMPGEDAPS
ncbi:MAG: hypothetical protein M3065_06130 [Actinomycetota bacterium]|nr:hypothetical protein [Actinomycetota bacterium]